MPALSRTTKIRIVNRRASHRELGCGGGCYMISGIDLDQVNTLVDRRLNRTGFVEGFEA
jgi:hypothetical protein